MQSQVLCQARAPCRAAVRLPSGRAARGCRAVVAPRRQLVTRQPRLGCTVRAVLDVTTETFEAEVLKSELPVLVDFWASWCGPCRLVAPTMDWAEKAYAGKLKVVKVEADGNKDLIEQYKVYGLPALVVIKDGESVSKHEGAITKQGLINYLAKQGLTQVEVAV